MYEIQPEIHFPLVKRIFSVFLFAMHRLIGIFSLIFIILLFPGKSTGGGGQHYPNGAEGFLCGIAPDPGLYLVNYTTWYTSSSLRDNHGNDLKKLDFHLNLIADAPRLLYFPKFKILGASYGIYLTVPIYHANIKLKAGGFSLMNDSSSGTGDLVFSPLILGWHFQEILHWVFSFDISPPSGHYDARHPATTILSRNIWSFMPNLSVTWLVGPGIDISLKFLSEFHTKNHEYRTLFGQKAELEPGAEFHVDYAVGLPLSPDLRVGINGFFYQQLQDDRINDKTIENDRGRVFAIGPAARYSWKSWAVIFKEQFEIWVRNRPKGNISWIKIQHHF